MAQPMNLKVCRPKLKILVHYLLMVMPKSLAVLPYLSMVTVIEWLQKSHFTDDKVCTIGIARWLSCDPTKDASRILRETCLMYPRCGYGGMFSRWVTDDSVGPYNSWGNGAPMRVSPAGWYAKTLEESYHLAESASNPTHNHPQAVKGAKVVAGIIHLLKNLSLEESMAEVMKLDSDGHYASILSKSIDEIRPNYTFKVSSKDTVPQALLCVREATSFEDAIRNAISLGGDADTLAAITGSIAECIFDAPEEIEIGVFQRLDKNLAAYLTEFYKAVSFR